MSHNRRYSPPPPKPPRKKPQGLFAEINHIVNRLPIPTLGRFTTLLGIGGLFIGTLALALVFAVFLRGVLGGQIDAGDSLPTLPPNATPNPDFLAPTVALGNAPVWQGSEPVTVLLMGADTRPSERGGNRPRTDTMMLLMADPVNKRAGILSVPRDLFVDVPGYGLNRVNSAYVFGGSDLAVQTIQYNLGTRVNFYAMIEFNVFVTVVDEIGGVDINVPEAINDPNYPSYDFSYDPFYLAAGFQHLDGETALKYARTRHGNSDFDRASRQQALMFVIRDKVLDLNMMPTLIQKAPGLYANLRDSMDTNLSVEQMISLAGLAESIPRENIRTGIIDANYVISYETPDGAQVEIPNRAIIGDLLSYVFWLEQ